MSSRRATLVGIYVLVTIIFVCLFRKQQQTEYSQPTLMEIRSSPKRTGGVLANHEDSRGAFIISLFCYTFIILFS